jgi:hypothetical protein
MEPHLFTDPTGRRWHVFDFKIVGGRKRAVPINRWDAEARAFIAVDTGEVRVYSGYFSYHSTESKILANELHFAKPPHATAADRMNAAVSTA